ncbi:archaemetzincin-2-like [Dendronephthya gigantea]|uniref:archaemetzincin-2-like n=1 Tax=Dendronephthya gigantea TaxID=151771 RepID=UPI00106B8C8C|nr:archaemetzincin-2-like [Dendronephthya gigantea]
MVIQQKALVGKLKKFPTQIQQLFALSMNFCSSQHKEETGRILFHPFVGIVHENEGQFEKEVGTNKPPCGRDGKNNEPLSQTYPQWKVMMDIQKLHSLQKRKRFKNRIVYILPLGTVNEKGTIDSMVKEYQQNGTPKHCSNLFEFVVKFTSLFFYGMEVKLLPFHDINNLGLTTRVHEKTNRKQVLVTDILTSLKEFRPNDAFCVIGWSSLDLYPCAELNFVLGEACFDTGCAVISFAHYADVEKQNVENNVTRGQNIWNSQNPNETFLSGDISCLSTVHDDVCLHWSCTIANDKVVWRLIKVLTHEVCHLLGLHHCTFFSCLMNESKNISEAQNQPMFLCPICLRKLQKFLKFPTVLRYKTLKDFLQLHFPAGTTGFQLDNTKWEEYSDWSTITSDNDHACNSFAMTKIRSSLNWLDSILEFIS